MPFIKNVTTNFLLPIKETMNIQNFEINTKKNLLLFGSIILSFGPLTQAATLDLGLAGQFNAFILGDMTSYNSDTEGKLAVGGNLTLQHYAVGKQLDNSSNFQDTLVVGGNADFSNGRVYHGNAAIGGTANIGETVGLYSGEDPSQSTGTITSNPSLNFSLLGNELTSKSQNWGNLTSNADVLWDSTYNLLTLTGQSNELNIFSITSYQLANLTKFTLDIPTNASALINVSGIDVSMNDFGFFRTLDGVTNQVPDSTPELRLDGRLSNRVMFNMFEAASLDIHAIGIKASLLAPFANTTFYNGHIDGNLIVASLQSAADQQGGQINLFPWQSSANLLPVPLPGMAPIVAFLLGGLWFNNKRNYSVKTA